jgi:DNA-binding beta-propeller fold protein YncE
MLTLAWLLITSASADPSATCANEDATRFYHDGFAAQQGRDTEDALGNYTRCIAADPKCVPCWYEKGWSHWTRSEWDLTIQVWEQVLALDPNHGPTKEWLPQARDNKSGGGPSRSATGLRIPMGTASSPKDARVAMKLVARFQNYDSSPSGAGDTHDPDIFSPKSARFLSDGSKVYVNSLEGLKTPVYNPKTKTKITTIDHVFGPEDGGLFQGLTTIYGYPYYRHHKSGDDNQFGGKPVESALSHSDRYLWVPYYRRDFDVGARSPSAVSIIDTQTDTIVRVLPTGPIPKYVAISPDNHWAAISHWGDNTVAMVDISSGNPATFKYAEKRMVVEKILDQKNLGGNRDASCGSCLRGTVFSPDGTVLLVARMGDGGIAGFDVASQAYLGTVKGMPETPRHLVFSPDGQTLYFSANRSGHVGKIATEEILRLLRGAKTSRVERQGWDTVYVGGGARTLEVSPDGKTLFAAVNGRSQIVAVDSATLKILAKVRTDSYTVGLAVSPDGSQVWTTSQGRGGKGGNSVCVYEVTTN